LILYRYVYVQVEKSRKFIEKSISITTRNDCGVALIQEMTVVWPY